MKKIVKFAASLLVLAGALVSCQKETLRQQVLDTDVPTSFTASFEQTKLTIDGFKPVFELGDELTVEGSNNAKATFAVSEVSATGAATFKIKGSWSATPVAPYFVYNGTPAMVFFQSNMLAFNAPNNVLSAEPNSLDLATMVAKTDDLSNVTLLNASCLLKIVVPEGVKALKIAPGSGSITSIGSINFTSYTNISVGAMSTTPTQMAFTGNNGAGLSAGTYYVPLFPQTFNGGVRVGVSTDGTEYQWKEKAGNFIFQRNRIYDMGNIADWFAPEPKFAVEDLVGSFSGTITSGFVSGGRVSGNPVENCEFTVVTSDNATKGNIKFTKFAGKNDTVYAQFDLVTGSVTTTVGSVFTTDFGPITSTASLVMYFNESKDKLSLSEVTAVGIYSGVMDWGFAAFELTKAIAPVGPTVDDFAGTFKGTYTCNYNALPTKSTVNDLEVVFEVADQGSYNFKLKSMGSVACNALGTLDLGTRILTIPAGQKLAPASNYALEGEARPLAEDLKLQFSEDKNSFKMLNTPNCAFNYNSYPAFYIQILTFDMVRSGGEQKNFPLSEISGKSWAVSYTANGTEVVRNAVMTIAPTSSAQETATGCNVLVSNFLGSSSNSAFGIFDEETGLLTIPKGTSTLATVNDGHFYLEGLDWTARTLDATFTLQMSFDLNSLSPDGANPSFGGVELKYFYVEAK